jgi:hypothetical protein
MAAQRLASEPFSSPVEAVRFLGAVQAQEYPSATWGIAQRSHPVTSAAVDVLFNRGELLRTHVLRPTWHFVDPADIRWLLSLTGPRVHQANAYYYRKFELDDETLRASRSILEMALRDGEHLTRREIATALADGGISASGPRLAYILMFAELEAVICSGPFHGKQHTYALLDDRVRPVPETFDRDEALGRIVHRYFSSHGPATVHDCAWWSGLTVSDVRRGIDVIGSAMLAGEVDGVTYWYTDLGGHDSGDTPVVRLLPVYDEYLVAFKIHTPVFEKEVLTSLDRGDEAIQAHNLMIDGIVVGGWRRTRSKRDALVSLKLLRSLIEAERLAVVHQCDRLAAYLEVPVALESS